MKKDRLFLVSLIKSGYKEKFYPLLKEEMFSDEVDRKIIRAIKDGYKFDVNNLDGFRKVAGIGFSDIVQLATDVSNVGDWVWEEDVLNFVKEYNTKKAKEYYRAGEIEKAVECLKGGAPVQTDVIGDYHKHLVETRKLADLGLLGIPTGITKIDEATSGFRPGKIWIIGGYNAYGKTYFMTNMINRVLSLGKKACVITLEMSKEDIIDRLLSERLGIGVYELAKTVNKEAVDEELKRIESYIDSGKFVIIDSIYDIDEIKTKLRVVNANGKIDVLFIDFVQLITDKESKSSYEALKNITTALQALTKELGCCTMLLSQISNEAQKEGTNSIYGFKGAGEIGQIADVAIRIVRKKNDDGEMTDDYILDVVKNRTGRSGIVECKISFPSGKITEVLSQEDKDESVKKYEALESLFGL